MAMNVLIHIHVSTVERVLTELGNSTAYAQMDFLGRTAT